MKKALEALPGVLSAEASHRDGIARVEAEKPLDENALRQAVEAEDYEVKGIRKE